MLLAHGADAFVRNRRGQTAIDLASWDGNRQVAVLRLTVLPTAPSGSLDPLPNGR